MSSLGALGTPVPLTAIIWLPLDKYDEQNQQERCGCFIRYFFCVGYFQMEGKTWLNMDFVKERYVTFPRTQQCGLYIFRLNRNTFVPYRSSLYKFLSGHVTVSHTQRQHHLKEYFCKSYIPGEPNTLPCPSSEGSISVQKQEELPMLLVIHALFQK